MKKNINIAVYGTLRKGYGNHRVLGNSKFIGSGRTVDKYKLTANGIPFVNKNEPVSNVKVEVYSVTPEQLPTVDALEGYDPKRHEESWYKRTPINVKLENGETIEASIYFSDRNAETLIETGDYEDYRQKRF